MEKYLLLLLFTDTWVLIKNELNITNVFTVQSEQPSEIIIYFQLNKLWLKSIRQSFEDIRGSLNKFPDFFRMGTFIDSTQMKL